MNHLITPAELTAALHGAAPHGAAHQRRRARLAPTPDKLDAMPTPRLIATLRRRPLNGTEAVLLDRLERTMDAVG